MELLSVKEAAQRAGVTNKAIYYSLKHGKLTPHKLYGRVLVDASEIGRYSNRQKASHETIEPEQPIAVQRNYDPERLLALIDKWMNEDPEYNEKAYEILKKTMDENPIRFREYVIE